MTFCIPLKNRVIFVGLSDSYTLQEISAKWSNLGDEKYIPIRSQWPRCLRRSSAAACLLRSWVRFPPGPLMSVCCECCVLLGRALYDELLTRLEESTDCGGSLGVCSRNLMNEEALAHWGAVAPKEVEIIFHTEGPLVLFGTLFYIL